MITDSNISNSTSLTTEQRILKAADYEFTQKGFAGARTTAIAEAAGVTHAMLHYYYRTKQKLFSKVISDKLSGIANTFIIKIDDERSLAESIRTAVETHFNFLRYNPSLPKFMVNEVFPNPEILELLQEKIGDIAVNTLLSFQQKINLSYSKGECRNTNAREIIMDIIALNVFAILSLPLINSIAGKLPDINIETFLDTRREENVQTILTKLGIR